MMPSKIFSSLHQIFRRNAGLVAGSGGKRFIHQTVPRGAGRLRHRRPTSSLPVTLTSSWCRYQHADGRTPLDSNGLRSPTPGDVDHFRSVLSRPGRSVLSALPRKIPEDSQQEEADVEQELERYNSDWTRHYRGSSSLVLRPRNTSEVSSILKYCHDNHIGVVPQGGNTGLCGGATPMTDEVVLSLEDMDSIHHLDEHSGILTCDAGAILHNLHEYANDRGYLFPLDIGSRGTCQIGGNVSTNAGGQYFFRFGSLHGTVTGMEVVLPDGRVLHLNMEKEEGGKEERYASHRKDNTGYDMKHLFIGAEGTLGIVTKVAIACPALPTSKNATFLVCDSCENVLTILKAAKEELGETLSACELMDSNILRLVRKNGLAGEGGSRLLDEMLQPDPSTKQSEQSAPLYLLVETQGSNSEHDAEKMDAFLTRLFDDGTIDNGILAQDSKQIAEMWGVRESCNPSAAREGCVYKFDVSIPAEDYVDVALEVEEELLSSVSVGDPDGLAVCVWGHVADGNAHVNVVTPGRHDKDPDLAELIESTVYDSVLRRGGSISAEHGLGRSKNQYLGRVKGDGVLDAMVRVKSLFDPHGIMNPGKYLPTRSERI